MGMARVMVVDDSPTDKAHLKRILSRAGYDVSEAATGQDALDLAKKTKPDCVVMDLVMPGMNGFHATRQLAKDPETANIPVIIVSSKNQPSDRVWALRQGAKEYVVKPVNEAELIAKLKSLIGV
jgi:twitching motility two-component system response regulator PilH